MNDAQVWSEPLAGYQVMPGAFSAGAVMALLGSLRIGLQSLWPGCPPRQHRRRRREWGAAADLTSLLIMALAQGGQQVLTALSGEAHHAHGWIARTRRGANTVWRPIRVTLAGQTGGAESPFRDGKDIHLRVIFNLSPWDQRRVLVQAAQCGQVNFGPGEDWARHLGSLDWHQDPGPDTDPAGSQSGPRPGLFLIALTPMDACEGTLRLLPGSHRLGRRHTPLAPELRRPVTLSLAPGDMLRWHPHLLLAKPGNSADRPGAIWLQGAGLDHAWTPPIQP